MRILNVRSAYEAGFLSAVGGDAESVRCLLAAGQASVLDVTDDSGHSPLHVSTSLILLKLGAESWS